MKKAHASPEASDNLLTYLVKTWNWFWFTPSDPTTLGLIRICAGLLVMYIHFAYTPDLQEFFGANAWVDTETADELRYRRPALKVADSFQTEDPLPPPTDAEEIEYIKRYYEIWRVDPRYTYAQGQPLWSVWFHVTDPSWMRAIHFGFLGIMFLFTIGFCTRITSVMTWLAALSYIQRSPVTLFGVDTMMNLSLIYLMIGPSGAALSVDRLARRYWLTWRALRRGQPAPDLSAPDPSVSANVALRLLQINFCLIYLGAGLSKLLGGSWWNGTALWMIVANYAFTPLHHQWYHDALAFLCRHRWLWEIVIGGGVVYTLFLEIGFPFLVWHPRLRNLMVGCAVLLHTGIGALMGLKTFSLFMITMVFSFVPGESVRRILSGIGDRLPTREYRFEGKDRHALRKAALVHALDVFNRVTLIDSAADQPPSPAVIPPARPAVQRTSA
ncbi:MAG: hypothetical protein ACK4RK_20450 [Gemmataceae bacterium]